MMIRHKIKEWFDYTTKPKCTYHRTSSYIHSFFGLSYSSYFCVPRLALQEMPVWWQWLFCWMVKFLPETPGYSCQRRDKKGHFIKDDPWANYRRGVVYEVQQQEKENGKTI